MVQVANRSAAGKDKKEKQKRDKAVFLPALEARLSWIPDTKTTHDKLCKATKLRTSVECKECGKPRCIYSQHTLATTPCEVLEARDSGATRDGEEVYTSSISEHYQHGMAWVGMAFSY